ncbi:hypothetical protein AB0N05_12540 [Nocardia sp. NPDC051030]|uniref:hypothetical protein n=1 Tax=Nocardia sp. NPDC051030 TaxID=3155162 RepID=UPI003447A583
MEVAESSPTRGPIAGSRILTAIAVLTTLPCGVLLWYSMSAGDFELFFLAGLGLAICGIAWLITTIVLGARGGNPRLPLVFLTPLIVLITLGLYLTDVPAAVGWKLSKSSLDSAAATCTRTGRIGVYTITSTSRRNNACFLYTDGGWINSIGFAHYPTDPPPPSPYYHYEHLDGPWYQFTERF